MDVDDTTKRSKEMVKMDVHSCHPKEEFAEYVWKRKWPKNKSIHTLRTFVNEVDLTLFLGEFKCGRRRTNDEQRPSCPNEALGLITIPFGENMNLRRNEMDWGDKGFDLGIGLITIPLRGEYESGGGRKWIGAMRDSIWVLVYCKSKLVENPSDGNEMHCSRLLFAPDERLH
ncbi:hypothetical protein CEXT_623511 [Caerostris extrusa]|uniref:Uncharacterized protein n=1 Tax=Caerostris extrusa TaxID=172846 RepID=A0AAV4UIV0_CAEEX|nr:hypothetical protein CEXT_623511 [Caerostris extrusa]